MALYTVALPVYCDDDPELNTSGSNWQVINPEQIQKIRDFISNVPGTRSALEMAINNVFSGSMSVSKKSGTLKPSVARVLRNWTSDVKAALMEVKLFGMAVMVVGYDGSVSCVPLHTISVHYKYRIDRQISYRGVIPSQSMKSTQDEEYHAKDGTKLTSRQVLERSRFYLFVAEKPEPSTNFSGASSGSVNSRFRSLTGPLSYLQAIRKAVLANSFNVANPSAATEQKDISVNHGVDANSANDLLRHGERQTRHIDQLRDIQRFHTATAIIASDIARQVVLFVHLHIGTFIYSFSHTFNTNRLLRTLMSPSTIMSWMRGSRRRMILRLDSEVCPMQN